MLVLEMLWVTCSGEVFSVEVVVMLMMVLFSCLRSFGTAVWLIRKVLVRLVVMASSHCLGEVFMEVLVTCMFVQFMMLSSLLKCVAVFAIFDVICALS